MKQRLIRQIGGDAMTTTQSSVTVRNGWIAVPLVFLFTFAAQAKKPHIMALTPPTPAQIALLERAIANEKVMEKEIGRAHV